MDLGNIFNAGSVAIIGASRNRTKRGYQAIRTLLDGSYEGMIYPVNPKEKMILGLPCYASVTDIKDPVDLALVATPAGTVPGILEACGKKGVHGAIILAGGFGELGAQGRELEQQIVAVGHKHKIRIIGPNTSGMMNLKSNMNLVGFKGVRRGDIALLAQSGNMALTLMTEAGVKSRKGFTYYVGVGNEADVRFHEYLHFLRNDPDTRAIIMYVEGMRQGREFLQEAYRTTRKKPVILLKSGRSATGRRSAGSHTGALAGISQVAKGAFERAGITVIENSDELFPVAETLSSLPPMGSNKIAILADGGGHATIAADLLTELGVELPSLSEKTQGQLRQILPAGASVVNPVDVAGGTDENPAVFADCAEIMLKDSSISGLLVVGLFGGYGIRFAQELAFMEEEAAHRMGKIVRKKPIVVHSLFSAAKPHALELLRYYGITVYDSLDVACKCISALAQYGTFLKSYHAKTNFVLDWGDKACDLGTGIISSAQKEHRVVLMEHEAKRLLQAHGADSFDDRLAESEDDAAAAAAEIPGKVVLKIVSPDILHKSDAGGVRLNIETEKQVRQAYQALLSNARSYKSKADIRGVLVAPMAAPGLEVIIGTKYDDQFGPVIMFGIGGIMVEILQDVTFRVLPISPLSAKKMLQEIKLSRLLNGFRGNPPADKKALSHLLLKCSELVESYPQIDEMDLNPVIVYETGLQVVDARILLKQEN
jgi:acetyltransferase